MIFIRIIERDSLEHLLGWDDMNQRWEIELNVRRRPSKRRYLEARSYWAPGPALTGVVCILNEGFSKRTLKDLKYAYTKYRFRTFRENVK